MRPDEKMKQKNPMSTRSKHKNKKLRILLILETTILNHDIQSFTHAYQVTLFTYHKE